MKIIRSHILKHCIILLLMMGFVSTLAEPVDAARSHVAFSNWLQSLAKNAPSPDVRQQLEDLKKSKTDLGQLIKRASHIVNRHNGDFNLPSHAGLSDLQRVLLMEWNRHCTGNSSMAAVPSFETTKTLLLSHQKAGASLVKISAALRMVHAERKEGHAVGHITYYPSNTVPLINGIAIGAP